MGNWWLAASSWQCTCSCITSHAGVLVKHQITQVTQPPFSPDLAPCDIWVFPKLKSPLKGMRFQTTDDIWKNTMGQLMVIGRTGWGPKVPTLVGTEAYCPMYNVFCILLSSSINVSNFHIIWLDTFWTAFILCYWL